VVVMMNELDEKQPHHRALHIDEFKERCLELIAEIYRDGGTVIIADDDGVGVEMVRYVESPLAGYGSLKGKIKILGEIEGPMPVEWYTHPDIQTDDDWDISGPMPASWFAYPDGDEQPEYQMPDKVDVAILHRHKLLTVGTGEFAAQLEEIMAAISGIDDGKVIIFDDEKPLVEITRHDEKPDVGGAVLDEGEISN